MKYTFRMLGILLVVGLAACSNPKKKITGSWGLDDVVIDFPSLKQMPDSTRNIIEEQMKADIALMKKETVMIFGEKDKYETRLGKNIIKGKWELDKSKKKIIIRPEATGFADTMPFDLEKDGRLRLHMKSPMGKMEMVMKKMPGAK